LAKGYEITSGNRANIPTLKEYLVQWLKNKSEYVEDRTVRGYEERLKDVIRVMDNPDILLPHLTTSDLEQVKHKLIQERDEKGTKNRTINIKMSVVKSAITHAYNHGLILRNIGLPIEPLPENDSTVKGFFTETEIEKLLKFAHLDWKGVILFSAHTGLRCSNVCELKWEDINWSTKELTVIHYKQGRMKKVKVVKHHAMTPEMLGYLEFIGKEETGFLFPKVNSMNKHTRPNSFAKIMLKARVPKVVRRKGREESRTFHCVRHSFNTFLANGGVNIEDRCAIIGHATEVINEVYTHRDQNVLQEIVLKSMPKLNWQTAQ